MIGKVLEMILEKDSISELSVMKLHFDKDKRLKSYIGAIVTLFI